MVIAHRGASGYRPEHTRAAYELAIEQGAHAIEPDIVVSRDGVLVVRHENEISGTTDVADRSEFADRRTTKVIDGEAHTGWFTEDFDWAELATLRCRERIPGLRPASAAFDGGERMLRLAEVAELAAAASVTLVAEVKHATYFASIGLPLGERVAAELASVERLVIESFERSILLELRERGIAAPIVYLFDEAGAAADQPAGPSYALELTRMGELGVDGVSVAKSTLLADPELPRRAHSLGLLAYTWTLRPENHFLDPRWRDGTDDDVFGDYRSEWAAIFATGVDGVFADHPNLAREVLGTREGVVPPA
jgi:glycerophosphoryl diester phosphodiesterase